MCTCLVTQAVTCLVPVSELACVLMSILLVTQTVACPVSGGGLNQSLMCTSSDMEWGLSYFRV